MHIKTVLIGIFGLALTVSFTTTFYANELNIRFMTNNDTEALLQDRYRKLINDREEILSDDDILDIISELQGETNNLQDSTNSENTEDVESSTSSNDKEEVPHQNIEQPKDDSDINKKEDMTDSNKNTEKPNNNSPKDENKEEDKEKPNIEDKIDKNKKEQENKDNKEEKDKENRPKEDEEIKENDSDNAIPFEELETQNTAPEKVEIEINGNVVDGMLFSAPNDKLNMDIYKDKKKQEFLDNLKEETSWLLEYGVNIDSLSVNRLLLLQEGYRYIGTPYVYGGKTPNGFDCSGFTQYVINTLFNIDIGSSSSVQHKHAQMIEVPIEEAKPGDLIRKPGHVGFYIGLSNKPNEIMVLHARQFGTPLSISSYTDNVKVYRLDVLDE